LITLTYRLPAEADRVYPPTLQIKRSDHVASVGLIIAAPRSAALGDAQ
jgi:hypothetical protein